MDTQNDQSVNLFQCSLRSHLAEIMNTVHCNIHIITAGEQLRHKHKQSPDINNTQTDEANDMSL